MKTLEGILVDWLARDYLNQQKIVFEREIKKIPRWYRTRFAEYLESATEDRLLRLNTQEYLAARESAIRLDHHRRQFRIDIISFLLTGILLVLFTILIIYLMILMGRKNVQYWNPNNIIQQA